MKLKQIIGGLEKKDDDMEKEWRILLFKAIV